MKKLKVFKNGDSQAVRLSKDLRFSTDEVRGRRFGRGVLLMPAERDAWASLRESLDQFSDDFMAERSQGKPQKREKF